MTKKKIVDDEAEYYDNLNKLWQNDDSVRKPLHELFEIKCRQCSSSNVYIAHASENCHEGCESCGYGQGGKFLLALKCKDCGNAKVVQVSI